MSGNCPAENGMICGSVRAVHGYFYKDENLPEKPSGAMQAAVFGGNEGEPPVPGLFGKPCAAQEMKQVCGDGKLGVPGKAKRLENRKGKDKILVG